MSNSQKISAMPNAATPLTGAELVPIVQNGLNVKVASGLIGAINNLQYQGTWNASTNTPTITSSVGTTGYYYIVNTAGTTTINGNTNWQIGDWIIFSNTGVWQKISGGTISSLQIVNDSSGNTDYNLTFTTALSGLVNTEYVDNGILSFNPSKSSLTTPNIVQTIQPSGEVYHYFRKTNGWNVASINAYDATVTGGPNPPVNGGYFEIYVSDGVTEQAHQMNINWNGALGFSDQFGTTGQVLISAGFNGATHWGSANEIAGLGSMAFQNAGSAAITGGTITGSGISGGTVTGSGISGGSIDGTPIGSSNPASGAFTSLTDIELTPTEVVFVGSGGRLTDDSTFTFNSSTKTLSCTEINTTHDGFFNGMRVGHGAGNITSNSVVGANSLDSATSGGNNTAMGYQSLKNVTTGSNLTAFGYQAGYSATTAAEFNVFGYQAGYSNTTGHGLTAVGYQAGFSNQTGAYNTYIGSHVGTNSTGDYNCVVSGYGFYTNSSGSNNTGIGTRCLFQNNGSNNIVIGTWSGYYETAANNTFYLDSLDRGNLTAARAGAMFYGTLDATPANQKLAINAQVTLPTVKTTPVTYSSLPSASTAGAGTRGFITDCNSATFAAIAAGGGTNSVPVYSDGTNWRVG